MGELTAREALLEQAGFRYYPERMLYVSIKKRKVVSLEYVNTHTVRELQAMVDDDLGICWEFYFNYPPSARIMRDLIAEFQERGL